MDPSERRRRISEATAFLREEAMRAQAGGAYFSAVSAAMAGVEGVLVTLAVVHEDELRRDGRWPPSGRTPERLSWAELRDLAKRMKWLPAEEDPWTDVYTLWDEVGSLRERRNWIHPGRLAREEGAVGRAAEIGYAEAAQALRLLELLHVLFLPHALEDVLRRLEGTDDGPQTSLDGGQGPKPER